MWYKSKAFSMLWDFIIRCNEAIQGKKVSDSPRGSPIIMALVRMLDVSQLPVVVMSYSHVPCIPLFPSRQWING